MLIKEIYENFSLPIEFDESKKEIFDNLYQDLELLKSDDPENPTVYEKIFRPSSDIGKECLQKWCKYYTTNTNFLKDSQKLYKNLDALQQSPQHKESVSKCWASLNTIKTMDNFHEKFQYIDWDQLKFLNKSELFLAILTFYQFASPVLSLLAPIILLLIPFLILKVLKLPITIEKYIEVLKQQLDKHSMGQLFTRFNVLTWSQRAYLIMCCGMYLYQIYQNILACYQFYQNTKLITNTFCLLKTHLNHTKENITKYIKLIDNLESYNTYKSYLVENLKDVEHLYSVINNIPLATLNPHKIVSMGKIMKEFYLLQTCPKTEKILLFTFGFNGYIDTLNGLNTNIKNKHINPIKLSNKKSIKLKIKNLYHPCIEKKIVTNTIDLSNNKIITGPNAAGKTTILKASIINVLLSQQLGYGCYSGGYITPFHVIHCYLNIPDTNSRDSLFQAEARRCYNILNLIEKEKNKRHFCIFDELYSGTNPYEAIATAYAYLDFISKNTNVRFMLTTHYIRLCKLFKKHKTIKNYNMETEIRNNKALYSYKIIKGVSKIKGGVIVLKELNYPDKILIEAEKVIEKL